MERIPMTGNQIRKGDVIFTTINNNFIRRRSMPICVNGFVMGYYLSSLSGSSWKFTDDLIALVQWWENLKKK